MLRRRDRLIPVIVASPLFLQNLDASVMVTALPSSLPELVVFRIVQGLGGAMLLWQYTRHSRRRVQPLIDLAILRHRTFRASVVGGLPLRIAIGASPFLLPLTLQLGFGLSPLLSGALTAASSVGALGTRVVMTQAIRRFGFRKLLMGATVLSSLSYLG